MFIKSELTKERALKRQKKMLPGKTIKAKFKHFLPDVIERLKKFDSFIENYSPSIQKKYNDIINDHQNATQTTSNESALDGLIECYDDLDKIYDDVLHNIEPHTHEARLMQVITFLRDFHNTRYKTYENPYDQESSTLSITINEVTKTFKLTVAKIDHEMQSKNSEMMHLEKENKRLANDLESVSKQSVEYSQKATKITNNHQNIKALKSQTNTLEKNKSIMSNFAFMFEQLALNENYQANLKSEGTIKKLVKRVHKNKNSIDILEDTAELTDILKKMRDELSEIEAVIKPAQRIAFDDDETFDDDIVNQYKSMNNN